MRPTLLRQRTRQLVGLAIATGTLLFASGCTTTQPSVGQVETQRTTLLRTDAAFSETSVRLGIAEAFARYVAPDGMMLPKRGEPIRGPENVRKAMEADQDSTLVWTPRMAEVSASDDLGVTWGTYELRSRSDKDKPASKGKYLTVWRKQPNGQWRFLFDIGNEEPPATPRKP